MKFEELSDMVPYAKGGKEKILRMQPYKGVTLAMPGRHAEQTKPIGGDFCVMVTDSKIGWRDRQFSHTDIFQQVERRRGIDPLGTVHLMRDYLDVINGAAPELTMNAGDPNIVLTGMKEPKILDRSLFIRAVQCLAVAEHRRYAQFENKFGGRYLPFRFAAGIAEGKWSAVEAKEKERMGRPGVEWLEQEKGVPSLTEELINAR